MSNPHGLAPPEWGEALVQAEVRLARMIRVRMDPRIRARLDVSDAVQECFLEATRRRGEYLRKTGMPLMVWLRLIALQKLSELHRRHLRVKARSARREIGFTGQAATSVVLAVQLLGHLTTPSQAAVRDELEQKLIESLESLDPLDRECIVLRNFEKMSNAEAAVVLDLNESTASTRYVRALQKLRVVLDAIEGLSRGDWPL